MAGARRIYRKRPHGFLKINWAHPLARDLAFFYYKPVGGANGTFVDAVTGLLHGTSSGQTQGGSTDPLGGDSSLLFNGTARSTGSAYSNPRAVPTEFLTVFARLKITTLPGGGDPRCVPLMYGSNGSGRGAIIAINGSGNVGGGCVGTNGIIAAYDNINHLNDWVNVAGCSDRGNPTGGAGEAWVNGVYIGGAFTGSSASQATSTIWLGRDASGYFQNFNGEMACAIGFNRQLTDAEHKLLSDNPFVLIQPANDYRIFSFAGAGGTVYNVNQFAVSNAVAFAQKAVGKPLFGTGNSVAFAQKGIAKSFFGVSNSVGLVAKFIGKFCLATGNSVAREAHGLLKLVNQYATSNAVALATKAVSKNLVGVSNAVAFANMIKAKLVNMYATSNSVAFAKRDVGKSLFGTSNAIAFCVKAVSKPLLAVSNAVAFSRKAISKPLLAVSNSVAFANLIKAKLVNQFAVSNSVAFSQKSVGKNLTAVSNSVATFAKVVGKNIVAVSNSVPFVRKAISITRLAFGNSIAFCQRTIPLRFIAVSNSIAIAIVQLANSAYISWPEYLKTPSVRARNKKPKDRSRNIPPVNRDR